MWITPLPPSLTALGEGSHGSIRNGNYAPNRLSSAWKPTLLAVVTAANINAVEAKHDHDRDRLAHADQLAAALKLDMNSHWEAQAPFLSRLSKAQIAEVMEDADCGKAAIKAAAKAPKAEAVALAEKALAGKAWLPGPLRSNVDDEQQNQDGQQAMAAG